ncbi:MAG: selenide, water dikinase SelD [Bacteroidota bacterium]|nr:selenide, water dikinase SelD [Bacteroidota bacterium]
MEKVKLTQFSHGAGCGCKIAPKVLEEILKTEHHFPNANLLVGNSTKDDAAVYDLGNGQAIISTTDFFMPIVDDAITFGKIASVNAISDIYAMGGKPLMAIAILGWPINIIPASVAKDVLEGSRIICQEAGIPLAGGHSIDCPEPVFGLAVTGIAPISNIKRNDSAQPGDILYLTKPLGVGIITTAQKKGIVQPQHLEAAISSMLALNKIGSELGNFEWVHALTDVTGFGLLGHLKEICEASKVSAIVEYNKISVFDFLEPYLDQKSFPGGTTRNWESYGEGIIGVNDVNKLILCDPQTSGGLLVAVDKKKAEEFEGFMKNHGFNLSSFGELQKESSAIIEIKS